MVSDPIADTLIRIKNGYMIGQGEVVVNYSKLIWNLCNLLVDKSFVSSIKQDSRQILVSLKYNGKSPAIVDVKRVSKPGLRVYKSVKFLPRVLNGLGIAIISTPKGLMTDKEARKLKVGGEVMAEVW